MLSDIALTSPEAIAPIWDLASEGKQIINYVRRGAKFRVSVIWGDSRIEVHQLKSLIG
ncbi:hypothetical protein [Nostoc sp. FACHB-133]|uniref:hypothetical protein n=1 Tax=Nostoc sp. FACHB-133 TaxID=2692835 RepID=UPI00168333BC|nr:hypothetical protein [Nostoc sp. FACHB-133]MBD2526031.1 hypothetical protein [Nostoc sp. FACHB-133]